MPVDDYTLAAFLSGELPERERKSVASSLVFDQEAREILHMACEALAAAFASEPSRSEFLGRLQNAPARPSRPVGDRPSVETSSRRVA